MKQKIITFGAPPVQRSPDRSKAKNATQKRRRRRRAGRQTLNYLLIFIVAFSIFLVLTLTVFFPIEKITVIGSTKYASQELLDASGIKVGDNLFRVSEKAVSAALISKFPYVESVKLKRSFPPKITIEIKQVRPLGAVDTAGGYVVIGRTGRILEAGAETLSEAMTVVTGMYLSSPAVGRVLGTEVEKGDIIYPEEVKLREELLQKENKKSEGLSEKEKRKMAAETEADSFDMLLRLVDAVEETSFNTITLVDFSDRLNMLIVHDNRLMIELGSQANLARKLKLAQKVIDGQLAAEFEGILDVSYTTEQRYEAYTRPCNIEKELEQRQLRLQQMQNTQQEQEQASSGEENPELSVVPGSGSQGNSSEEASSQQSASEESASKEDVQEKPSASSSRDELAVVGGSAPPPSASKEEKPENNSSKASSVRDELAVIGGDKPS